MLAPKQLTPASPNHMLKCCSSRGGFDFGILPPLGENFGNERYKFWSHWGLFSKIQRMKTKIRRKKFPLSYPWKNLKKCQWKFRKRRVWKIICFRAEINILSRIMKLVFVIVLQAIIVILNFKAFFDKKNCYRFTTMLSKFD